MPLYKTDKKKNGLNLYRVRVCRIVNGKKVQKEKSVYGLDAARRTEYELLQKMQQPDSVDFYDLFAQYKKLHSPDIRKSSADTANRLIDGFVIPYFGAKKVNDVSAKDIMIWKNYVAEKGYSTKYNQNIYAYLRALLNFAVKMDYINSNPINKVDNFSDTNLIKKEMDYYNKDELSLFLEQIKKDAEASNDYKYCMFFYIIALTGMRKGEANALSWEDYDEKKGILKVRKSVNMRVPPYEITPPKNKSSVRDVKISPNLAEMLRIHKEQQVKGNPHWTPQCFICGGISPLPNTSIENANKRIAKLCEIKHIRIHDFRHSHASLLAHAGVNIQEIAHRLGHADVQMTWNTYSHLYPADEDRATEVLSTI